MSEQKREVKILKAKDRVIIPSNHETVLKMFRDMETEMGRLAKLLNEARAEYLKVAVK